MERNLSFIRNVDGNRIVIINDIRFKGRRKIDWKAAGDTCEGKG